MKRTKSKTANTLLSLRNTGTQTENFDSLIEIAKLEEQVKVLQLEIDVLRKHAETSNKSDDVIHHKPIHLTPQTTSKINAEKSSCGCKGNCSSRICGCVKKNNKCDRSCKCDDKMCQNQKSAHNQENKENKANITPKNQNKKKNEAKEKTKNNRGLFSPNITEIYKNFEESQLSDIRFSFNRDVNREKNTVIKSSQTDSCNINDTELKKKVKEKKKENNKEKKEENNKENKEENKKQQKSIENIIFDPMKPRHQLSRTPPKKLEKPLETENTIQPQQHFKSTQEVIISPLSNQDIKEEEIDWEEHTAQLIRCKKCKRTFLPDRIQKHEACCKKI